MCAPRQTCSKFDIPSTVKNYKKMFFGIGTLQLYFCSICAFSALVFAVSALHFWLLSYPLSVVLPITGKQETGSDIAYTIQPSIVPDNSTAGLIFIHLYNISHLAFNTVRRKAQPIDTTCGYRIIFVVGQVSANKVVRTQAQQHRDILQLPNIVHSQASQKLIIPEVKKYAKAICGKRQMGIIVTGNVDTQDSYRTIWRNSIAFKINPKKDSGGLKPDLDRYGWCMGNASQTYEDPYNENDLLTFAQHNRPDSTADLIGTAGSEEIKQLHYLLLEPQDHIVNKQEFQHIISEPALCVRLRRKPPYLLIFTHSSPANFRLRQKIRETWYSRESRTRNNIVNLFFLGISSTNLSSQTQRQIAAESAKFHDIIQLDFIDSYRNLTFKHTAALKYLTENCQNITYKFVLKTDDDMVLDVDSIVFYMKKLLKNRLAPPTRTIYCSHLMYREVIKRNTTFKWYISPEEYPGRTYPPYCYGAGYLMTPDLIGDLYNMSLYMRRFWVDDVYISGFVARNLRNVRHVQLPNQIPVFSKKSSALEILQKKRWLVHTYNAPTAFDRIWSTFSTRWNTTARESFKLANNLSDDSIFSVA
ncbi:uncharacterized protein LOC129585249 [Paramacrobiotus metropolitanus]|uniref:uncharacterized protein LOC129585249 n=1 Tax=Paramacrobiotus metropolitanus TaxID=2943436 RepID=UPI0024463740|nr:uncharacterized protein LOC129585249 [Paramacrobiotus metropolitanus]